VPESRSRRPRRELIEPKPPTEETHRGGRVAKFWIPREARIREEKERPQ
jgi:hypothetical protein